MAWEENSCICLNMQLIAILSRIGVYRYEGTAFGGGLSAGLVRPLSRRWNLEFELGLGVVWADWERYRCVNCGKRTGKGSGVYVTPTRTAVNLVYLF